jgi:small-conductance mechanosensitive channel
VFLGLTALGGGIEMLVWRHGGTYLPAERLDKIPFIDSYLLPGLILAGLFGLGSLVSAYGMLRTPTWRRFEPLQRRTRMHWSWTTAVAFGVAFTLWLTVELLLLGGPAAAETVADRNVSLATYAVFATVAVLLLVLPHTDTVRRHLAARPHGPQGTGSGPSQRSDRVAVDPQR